MKILVTYASAGAGHKTSAKAIFDLLQKETSYQVSLVDCLDYTSPVYKLIYSQGYAFLITYLSFIWSLIFKITDNRVFFKATNGLRRVFNEITAKRFIQYVTAERFDCCICTQFLPNEIISQLKARKEVSADLICVVTDFNAHRFWLADRTDIYTVACRETKQELLGMGVVEKKIRVTGIPVNSHFLNQPDKEKLMEDLGLKKGIFTLLLLTGSFGIGGLDRIVKLLQDRFQLLVVCGNNQALFRKLNRIKNDNTKVYGLIDNVDILMSVSDLAISKAGGLSIAEALVKHLPLVFIAVIPGQEAINAKLMIEYEIGLAAKDLKDIKDTVIRLALNHNALAYMKANTWRLSKPYAVREILQLIHG